VFNSEQPHIKTYGYATNWKSTGYFETHYTVRKYRVKVLSNSAKLSPDNITNNDHKSFFTNARLFVDNKKY